MKIAEGEEDPLLFLKTTDEFNDHDAEWSREVQRFPASCLGVESAWD
jgi:hypothetical protein